MSVVFRPLTLALALGLSVAALPACSRASADTSTTAESADETEGAVIEEGDEGSISWRVAPDGKVRAVVQGADKKPITKDISGELIWKTQAGETRVPIAPDEKGILVATGPRLEDDLTEIRYELTVSGKPWNGALHVPKGGTMELNEDARAAAAAPSDEKGGKTGPNGGVIQIVGKDRLEIVADKVSGEVRVYILGTDDKPAPVGERTVKLAVSGEAPEIVVLSPHPKGLYFTGKLITKADPVRITVVVSVKDESHACIVGWNPGVHLVVGAHAPRVRILVAAGWTTDVDVRVRAVAPSPAVVVVHDDDDDDDHHHGHVQVHVKEKHGKGHGKGGGKAQVSVKIH